MGKKIISFSLWGRSKIYNYGALENALLAPQIYPGWICRFYYNSSADPQIIQALSKLPQVELVNQDTPRRNLKHYLNTLWRFQPMFDPTVEIMISRDTDSRLNWREKAAVDQWLASSLDFHIMRDHPRHGARIMAGMFGCRHQICHPFKKNFEANQEIDQVFLKKIIYPKVVQHAHINASFKKFEKKVRGFPTRRHPAQYVGKIIHDLSRACHHLEVPPIKHAPHQRDLEVGRGKFR